MKITAYWLRKHGACPNQIAIFKKEWPEGKEITLAHLERALELGLNLEWLVKRLCFSPSTQAAYELALEEASAARAQALSLAEEANAQALDLAWTTSHSSGIQGGQLERVLELGLNLDWLYDRLCFSRAAYTKAMQPAWEAYERGLATARVGYNQAMISAEVAYTKAVRPAWEAYERGLATTQKNYGVQGVAVAKAKYKQIVMSAEATYKQAEATAKAARAQDEVAAKAAGIQAVAEALIPGARMRNYSKRIKRHAYGLWQRLSSRPFLRSLKGRNR